MNVLVIDTDPAVRRLIGDVLLSLDEWALLEAQDATTATAVMQDREADLILLDVALPDLPEVSQVIANLRYLRPRLPVIGLSIAAEPKLSDPLITAGVSQIIPKAFHAGELLTIVGESTGQSIPTCPELSWPFSTDPTDSGSLNGMKTPGRKVVIVDDDITTLTLLTDVLTVAGYDVTTATDGPTGLAKIDNHSPDLVILDHMLPGMHGIDVVQQLRQQGSRLPIIMLTAHGNAKVIRDEKLTWSGWKAGASLLLDKPCDIDALLRWVEQLIATRTHW